MHLGTRVALGPEPRPRPGPGPGPGPVGRVPRDASLSGRRATLGSVADRTVASGGQEDGRPVATGSDVAAGHWPDHADLER